jgi:hypothetical protein
VDYNLTTKGLGVGVQNIEIQNHLLSKWLFKLINKVGLSPTIIRKKYLASQRIEKAQKKLGCFTILGRLDE